jgi:hypothetical protein
VKIEATTTAALAAQSATAAAATVAITENWWFAVITAAVGALLAVHAERAYRPGELRRVVVRLLMLTGFSWLVGAYVGAIEAFPITATLSFTNPAAHMPAWVRTGLVGLFSPYLHAVLVAQLKRRAGVADRPAT